MDTLQNTESTTQPPTCDFSIVPNIRNADYTVAGISYTGYNASITFTNDVITFNGIVNVPPGVSIIEYYWDMGDGTELYGKNVAHTYNIASSETRVVFCVTDNYRRKVCTGRLLNLRPGIPAMISGYVLQP